MSDARGMGPPNEDDPALVAIRRSHRILDVDEQVGLAYARITHRLRGLGMLIGANDLWIAATSLHHGLPLVTADVEHFMRLEGLEVVSYR